MTFPTKWPPNISGFPPLFRRLFQAFIDRMDAAWPVSGIGSNVTDAAGGGRSVNVTTPLGQAAGQGPTPLRLVSKNDGAAKGDVIYGTVKGMDVTPSGGTAVIDGDHGWVQIVVSFDDTTGVWSYDSVALAFGASVPAPDATNMYLNLGVFAVTGVLAVASPALSGSQDVRRCGTPDAFTDNNGLV